MLSSEEEELLTKHMDFYRALETGQRQPATEAQEHFVRVIHGLAAAETIDEELTPSICSFVQHKVLPPAVRILTILLMDRLQSGFQMRTGIECEADSATI